MFANARAAVQQNHNQDHNTGGRYGTGTGAENRLRFGTKQAFSGTFTPANLAYICYNPHNVQTNKRGTPMNDTDHALRDLCECVFADVVEDLFEKNRASSFERMGDLMAHDPTFGLYYMIDDERVVAILKERTRRALTARAMFRLTGPDWAQPLPLSYEDRQLMLFKNGNRMELLWHFAESLANALWDRTHPAFQEFGQGVMASEHAPEHLRQDPELLREFPPQPLVGLSDDLGWYSEEMLAEEARLQELMWGSSAAADAGHEVREV
jgi:hypothetical protein